MKRTLKLITALLVLAVCSVWAANELTVTQGVIYDKDGRKSTQPTTSVRHDVTGNGAIENIQVVSTNTEGDALVVGGVATAGFATFANLGPIVGVNTNETPATNSIQVGLYDVNTNFLAFLKINTNQSAQVWLNSISVRARAMGTNSVRISYTIIDK